MTYPTHAAVLQAARALFEPGDVVEVRVPKANRQRTISGYFDDLEKLALIVAQLEGAQYPGVYWTLNPVNPALLSRSVNRVQSFVEVTTKDPDIVQRRWLPVDLDPKRPTGISSTDDEHHAALSLAERIHGDLGAAGWPLPISADSGNGAHLLYRVDLPNDEASEQLLQRILQALGKRYSTPEMDVDQTTFNPSRIFKAYGTTARKGDNTNIRPHRLSRILRAPGALTPVPLELLQALACESPAAEKRRPTSSTPSRPGRFGDGSFSVEQFLTRYGIQHRAPVPCEGGRKFVLEYCPFNSDHKAPDAAVFDRHDGPGFKCFHNSCNGREWRDLRDLFEPNRGQSFQAPLQHQPAAATSQAPQSDASDAEIPLTAGDVEAAIEEAIAKEDLIACIRMAPEVAKLPKVSQVIIKVRLKQAFGRDFSAGDFDKLLKGESDDPGQKSTAASPPGNRGHGDDEDEDSAPPEGPDLRGFPLTDAGNGERLVELFGRDIRYCIEMKSWLVWDGKRWAIDSLNVMRQRCKQVARTLYLQAIKLDQGEARSKALGVHARNSESAKAISNAMLQAATEPAIPISAVELDQQPMLLNCPNGVLDLRTGRLLPHNRDFLITKLCPVNFDPKAECPQFMRFIEWAMGAINPEAELEERTVRLVGFLQRALGYSLTANVSEKALFVCYGEKGNNGKTTLLTLFRELLGTDYSGEVSVDTMMAQKQLDATMRADLADLRGVRFAQTSEVEDSHRLKEGQLKYLTSGMGTIKSCRKYENPIVFGSSHKLWMDCNHRPEVRGVDPAIWKRLKLVPFEMRIEDDKLDTGLKDKLSTEMPGILAWAVRGCLAWQKLGLGEPPEVAEANMLWREHDDPLKDFLEDCCNIEPELFVKVGDIGAGYEYWAKENREKYPISGRAFKQRLLSKGFKEGRSRRDANDKQFRSWEGIELKSEIAAKIRHSGKSNMWRDEET